MTNEEAIKELIAFKDKSWDGMPEEVIDIAIMALESYDKIIERLEDEEEYAYADFGAYASDYGLDEEYDCFFHKGLQRAVQVIKKEIRNEHTRI